MDALFLVVVVLLAWRWLRSLWLPARWALGGAVLIAAVLYVTLLHLLATVVGTFASFPLLGAVPVVLLIGLIWFVGYYLGRSGFPISD